MQRVTTDWRNSHQRMAFGPLVLRGATALAAFLFASSLAAEIRADESKPTHASPSDHHDGKVAHPKEAAHVHEPTSMEHVLDDPKGGWHLFETFEPKHIHLPFIGIRGVPIGDNTYDIGFQLTKFMVLELIAAVLVLIIYLPLARRAWDGKPPKGGWRNAFESLLTFVRDEIAKPCLGDHDADRFVPFLWTLFLFILFNNLLGMFPFFGSATASIFVTLALALCVFFAIHGSAISKMGFGHYIGSMWPHIDVPGIGGLLIKSLVFVIEVFGVLVRNMVLAVRLFANMFAGHMVLATILIFIFSARNAGDVLWGTVTFSSVLGMVLLSLLELFVAFLQAYIFTFLASLFIGMAVHPQH